MNQFEQWIARQRRRLSLGVFLTAFTDAMALFLLVLGSSVLLVKLARPGLWPGVLCLAALVLPLLAWAWWTSRRRGFSRSQAVALLDSKTGVNGLLMTLCETTGPQSNGGHGVNGHTADEAGWAECLAAQNPDWRTVPPAARSLPARSPAPLPTRAWIRRPALKPRAQQRRRGDLPQSRGPLIRLQAVRGTRAGRRSAGPPIEARPDARVRY